MAEGRFNWGVGTGSFPGDMQVFGYWGDNPAINNQSYTRARARHDPEALDRPRARRLRERRLSLHRARDRDRHRAQGSRPPLPEAASPDRCRRRLAPLVHAEDGRRQGLDAHVHQPRAPGAASRRTGRRSRRARRRGGPYPRCQRVARRPRGRGGGNRRQGPEACVRGGPRPRFPRLLPPPPAQGRDAPPAEERSRHARQRRDHRVPSWTTSSSSAASTKSRRS